VKQTPLKRKSKSLIRKTQDVLWELCKQIVRLKYKNVCYTCGKTGLVGSDWHTGHLLPKASCGAYLKYDLRILRPQCYNCNINLGGNGAVFLHRMKQIEGSKYVDSIFRDRQKSVKAIDHYLSLIPQYQDIFNKLQ